MAHVSLENLNLRNWLFVYCIIRKLHDRITIDYTMLMGLCKNTRTNMALTLGPLSLLVVHHRNKKCKEVATEDF